jgi:hypothetical protein
MITKRGKNRKALIHGFNYGRCIEHALASYKVLPYNESSHIYLPRRLVKTVYKSGEINEL